MHILIVIIIVIVIVYFIKRYPSENYEPQVIPKYEHSSIRKLKLNLDECLKLQKLICKNKPKSDMCLDISFCDNLTN